MAITKLRGTNDFFNSEAKSHSFIIDNCKKVADNFGFSEIVVPIIEGTELFNRSVGESSDVVRKEMYTFFDRSDRSITLRPEGTAGVCRAFVEHKLYANPGLTKLYYYGPMFRYERPSAGRYRQFNQFGCEIYGKENPYLDADMINLCAMMLNQIGIKKTTVHINMVASGETRKNYVNALRTHFQGCIDELCEDCHDRLEKNPLRILDCKVDKDHPAIKNAIKISDFLSDEETAYFNQIKKMLDEFNIKYEVDDHLVRGLDYYTGCVFEFILDDETSPLNGSAIAGGGRYNNLVKELGGPDTDAFGFAFGIERMMEIIKDNIINQECDICVINLGTEFKQEGLKLASYLRSFGKKCEIDYESSSLKGQFKLADRVNAKKILIFGEDEINNDIIQVKDKILNTQKTIKLCELATELELEGDFNYAYKK